MNQTFDLSLPDPEQIFCFSSNFRRLLEIQGVFADETAVFVSSDLSGFFCDPLLPLEAELIHGRTGDLDKSLACFAQNTGSELRIYVGDREEAASFFDGASRDLQRMTVVWLDDFYLEYSQNHYQRNHFYRLGFISPGTPGADSTGFIDFYDLGVRRICLNRFLELTKIPLLPNQSFPYRWYTIGKQRELGNRFLSPLSPADSLRNFQTAMNSTRETYGFHGIHNFLKIVSDLVRDWEFLLVDGKGPKLSRRLYFLLNAPGGPKISRYFFFRYLSRLGGDNPWHSLADLFGECAKGWEVVGNMFFRIANFSDPKLLARLVSKAENLAQREAALVKKVEEFVR